MRHRAVLAVPMFLKIKVGQAADVAHSFHKDSVVAHKVQDGLGAVGQREVQHKGSQQDAGHLLQELGSLCSNTAQLTQLKQQCIY